MAILSFSEYYLNDFCIPTCFFHYILILYETLVMFNSCVDVFIYSWADVTIKTSHVITTSAQCFTVLSITPLL